MYKVHLIDDDGNERELDVKHFDVTIRGYAYGLRVQVAPFGTEDRFEVTKVPGTGQSDDEPHRLLFVRSERRA